MIAAGHACQGSLDDLLGAKAGEVLLLGDAGGEVVCMLLPQICYEAVKGLQVVLIRLG